MYSPVGIRVLISTAALHEWNLQKRDVIMDIWIQTQALSREEVTIIIIETTSGERA